MKKWMGLAAFLLAGITQGSWVQANTANADYAERPEVKQFVAEFARKHNKHPDWALDIIRQGKYQQSIIDAISKPAERVLTWGDYRRIFIEPKRLEQGLAFWREHRELVESAAKQYQVAPEMILAIMGIETRYGRVAGNHKVIDALLTLGFDYPPRAPFFKGQLEQFLLLLDEQKMNPAELKGSYAGAMGYGQFIAGSYRAYAVDGDADGKIDIWQNKADAVASVANYFARHGWKEGGLVAIQLTEQNIDKNLASKALKPEQTVAQWRKAGVKIQPEIAGDIKATLMVLETPQGTEYWLGFDNFYAITRYNHSHLYAMAAYQFSQLLRLHLDMP